MKLFEIITEEYKKVTKVSTPEEIERAAKIYVNEDIIKTFFNLLEGIWNERDLGHDRIEKEDIAPYAQFKYTLPSLHLTYTPEDITHFAIALQKYEKTPAAFASGALLSALINHHNQETKYTGEYFLPLFHLNKTISYIGTENTANVRVQGDVSINTCTRMKSGCVIIDGNSPGPIGSYMKGGIIILEKSIITDNKNGRCTVGRGMTAGKIIVKGDAEYVGNAMSGGEIIVEGDTRKFIGKHMTGGVIQVNGTIHFLEHELVKGGEIYNREERIHPK